LLAIEQGVLIMHGTDVTALFPLPDEAATQRLGSSLAPLMHGGLVVYLEGDLGAGKTTLARALIRALGHSGPVKSPTYALVEVYVISSLYLYHFDFYRFESPEEFLDAGFGEYFNASSLCLVEWPDKAMPCLPAADLRITLRHQGAGRVADIEAASVRGASCVKTLTSTGDDGNSSGVLAPP
jgi:tRNA threonylcarbamoyladenosine biosynthesis protein TsaE